MLILDTPLCCMLYTEVKALARYECGLKYTQLSMNYQPEAILA